MKLPVTILCAAATAFALASCNGTNEQATATLKQVAAIAEQKPDSALLLLSAIEQPEKLPKKQRMEYALRKVQAKDKAILDISNDTTIFTVANHYAQAQDVERAALALFYAGRVRQEQKRLEEAAISYLQAIDYAKQMEDKTLLGMTCYNLGKINYRQLLIDNAAAYYKQAYLCFCSKPDTYRRQALALTSIGDCFSASKQPDSALYYLERGLDLAAQYGDFSLQSSICQSIGLVFREQGAEVKAKASFLQAARLGADSLAKVVLYRNLANSYLSLGRRDSAIHYMRLILQPNMQDTTLMGKATTHELLSGIEELQGDYRKALEHYKLYENYLAKEYESLLSSSLREVKEKYQLERLENEHNRRLIWHQRIIIVVLGLLLVATLVCLWEYHRYLRISKRLREKEQEMLTIMEAAKEVEEKERLLKEELALSFASKESMLNDLRQQRLDTLKKASLLKCELSSSLRGKNKRKFDLAIFGNEEGDAWQLLYASLNRLSNGFLSRLQQQYSQLSDTEFKLCCLVYAQFDNTDASTMLNVNNRTVHNLRSFIRAKLAIPSNIDICDFLNRLSRNENANS